MELLRAVCECWQLAVAVAVAVAVEAAAAESSKVSGGKLKKNRSVRFADDDNLPIAPEGAITASSIAALQGTASDAQVQLQRRPVQALLDQLPALEIGGDRTSDGTLPAVINCLDAF